MTQEEEIAKLKITIQNLKKKNKRLVEDFKIEKQAIVIVRNTVREAIDGIVVEKYVELLKDFNLLSNKRAEEGK